MLKVVVSPKEKKINLKNGKLDMSEDRNRPEIQEIL